MTVARRIALRYVVFAVNLVVLRAAIAQMPAPLAPDELVLIYNAHNPDSQRLAEYYSQRRGVPPNRLIGVKTSPAEQIERPQYDAFVAQLRDALAAAPWSKRIRCLVTFYGVPIRVGPYKPTFREQRLAKELERELQITYQHLDEQITALEALAAPDAPPPTSQPTSQDVIDLQELAKRYKQAATAAVQRLRNEPQPDAELRKELFLRIEAIEGQAGLMSHLAIADDAQHDAATERLARAREDLEQTQERINKLLRAPLDSPERELARKFILKFQGLRGLARILRDDRDRLRGEETHAALDSELALLAWDSYPLHRWMLNLNAWRIRADEDLREAIPPAQWKARTYMVCRLDGPTPADVRRIIDDSVEAETSGLKGNFYIDARGMTAAQGYGAYDQNLRDLAEMVKTNTLIPVVLDNEERLFQPGECPNAAFYCGWYSLRKYVPAFSFVPGAVGFHIASAEAVSLTGRNPVAEPYLAAFPLPKEFFGLLLCGKCTLAECFAYTKPFNSWMMMLIGDPLYQPFKSKPQLSLAQVFDLQVVPQSYGGSAPDPLTPTDKQEP
jgi:uncharacterized protein (TIGR03790 family)